MHGILGEKLTVLNALIAINFLPTQNTNLQVQDNILNGNILNTLEQTGIDPFINKKYDHGKVQECQDIV